MPLTLADRELEIREKRMQSIPLKVKEAIMKRSGGLCEMIIDGKRCCSPGDWRGLQRAHKINKGMGATQKIETADDLLYLCAKCHNVYLHRIVER